MSGGRPICGIELGQILFAMHDPARPKSDRRDGLSGIEVGFIRTISEIMDIVIALPALVREGPKRVQLRTAKITARDTRNAAKLAQSSRRSCLDKCISSAPRRFAERVCSEDRAAP